jgi:hypothetical protein
MGFRELICQLVAPSSASLIGDYLAAYAVGQKAAVEGQGIATASYGQRMMIDAVEARWRLKPKEKTMIRSNSLIPRALHTGAIGTELLSGPASHLPFQTRQRLIALSQEKNMVAEDLDPHARDSVFGPMLHVRVSMAQQHKNALIVINNEIARLRNEQMNLQADLLEASRQSTMSSARNRNLGRIAFRIRDRNVTPRTYIDENFQRAPLLESTLIWLDHLDSTLHIRPLLDETRALASASGKTIQTTRVTTYQFPQPIRRRRFVKPNVRKPKFATNDFGRTPWGRHAIERGNIEVVSELTNEHRKQVLAYQSARDYRKFTEHVLYGNSFVVSWTAREACSLTAIDPLADRDEQLLERVNWGDYQANNIETLRNVELIYPDLPILSLHYAAEGRAYFHCIRDNEAFNYHCAFSIDEFGEGSYAEVILDSNTRAVVVNQGLRADRMWAGTGPTSEEITAFQDLPLENYSNSTVELMMRGIESDPRCEMPMMACKYTFAGNEKVVAISSRTISRPWEVNGPVESVPYHRARCLADASLGAYWYSARKGVALRAFMRGCSGIRCSWVGSVIGWRMNVGSTPDYGYAPIATGNARTVAVIGGVSDEACLSQHYATPTGTGHLFIDASGIHQVGNYHTLNPSPDVAGLIMGLNKGLRFFSPAADNAEWLDARFPPLAINAPRIADEAAIRQLEALIDPGANMFF